MARVLKDKPYNHGTMTEAGFRGMIRSALRKVSLRQWKPIQECRKAARRPYTGENKRRKWEYQCNQCKNWFDDKNIEIDHKIDAGSLLTLDDLPGFVARLFCEIKDLQCVCKTCHLKKTHNKTDEL